MRKLMIVLTLAASWLAVSASVSAFPPPTCSPTCLMTR
jgi:hypothetical protein